MNKQTFNALNKYRTFVIVLLAVSPLMLLGTVPGRILQQNKILFFFTHQSQLYKSKSSAQIIRKEFARNLHTNAGSILVPVKTHNQYIFNQAALFSFGITFADLPTGSIMNNANPSAWEVYKYQIIMGCVFITMLFAGLIFFIMLFSRLQKARQQMKLFNESLEAQVHERTIALQKSNELLNVDIEKRKQIELQLREAIFASNQFKDALDHVNSYIYIKDKNSRYIYANRATLELFGCTDAELNGSDDRSFFPSDTVEKLRQIDVVVLQGGRTSEEVIVNQPDGTLRIYLEIKSPIYAREGGTEVSGLLGISTDITERKQIEYALRESEEKFRLLTENLTDVIWTADCETLMFTYVSPSVTRLRGYTPEEIMAEPMLNALEPAYAAAVRESIHSRAQALQNDESFYQSRYYTEEVQQSCKDGSYVWTEVVTQYWRNRKTHRIEMHGVTRNISERKLAEAALKESEEKHRILFTDSPDAYLIIVDGIFIDCNKSTEKMLHGTRSQIVGQSPDVLSPEFQPDGSKSSVAAEERINAALITGINVFEWVHRRFDGTDFYVEVSIALMTLQGQSALFTAWRDISRRKMAEAALLEKELRIQTISNNFTEGMIYQVIIQKDGLRRFTYLSESVRQLYGISPQEGMLDAQKIYQLIHPEDLHLLALAEEQAVSTLETFRAEARVVMPDGTSRWSSYVSKPKLLEDGSVCFDGIEFIITERKIAEAEIQRKNNELAAINASKDKLFSIIAHDLRTPFLGLLGLTEMMADTEVHHSPTELARLSNEMNQTANNLFKLLKNLLEWAQMQKGTLQFSPRVLFLNELLFDCIEAIKSRGGQKDISIQNNVTEPFLVFADLHMVSSVLLNLLSNAIKFTHRKGTIQINAYHYVNDYIAVSVTDSGIGMKQADLDNIFRIDEKTGKKGTEGELSTGLGLLLCKEFVERHGGNIWAESREGAGSTFTFTLKKSDNQTN